ncbi:hypothetical protein GCM10020219_043160 [Nonomuraea dietziae]
MDPLRAGRLVRHLAGQYGVPPGQGATSSATHNACRGTTAKTLRCGAYARGDVPCASLLYDVCALLRPHGAHPRADGPRRVGQAEACMSARGALVGGSFITIPTLTRPTQPTLHGVRDSKHTPPKLCQAARWARQRVWLATTETRCRRSAL